MNRLILLGNGFDLAHGMKTSYNDFILWYIKEVFNAVGFNKDYNDPLIFVKKRKVFSTIGDIQNISDLIDYFYRNSISSFLLNQTFKIENYTNVFENPFEIRIKSSFFKSLLYHCSDANWVDIENQYYTALKKILHSNSSRKKEDLEELNNSLKSLVKLLEVFLIQQSPKNWSKDLSEIFSSPIKESEIIEHVSKQDIELKETLVLNFNYTKTVEEYFNFKSYSLNPKNVEINYIHGKIEDKSNPLIFGFGDELDEDYLKMELMQINGFFEQIKSFWYFKTSNYYNLIRFLNQDKYQVFILGHSCGLSDRTMLNMIFEHANCKSIKIFYHKRQNGEDNFKDLTFEISRHFKNKTDMRSKIVCWEKCSPLPQI